MGVIQRQGLKHTIVSYAGVVIGLLSVLFIYPQETELYGLFGLLYGSSMLCVSFFLFGFSIHAVKFFPEFENKKNGHNGFLGFLITGGLLGFLCFLLFLPVIRYFLLDILFAKNESKPLFEAYFYCIIPLVFLLIFNNILLKYISNFHRIVVPTIFDQLLIKISLPILILLFIGGYLTTDLFIKGIIVNYILVFIGLFFYTRYLGELYLKTDFKFIKKPLAKEIKQYSIYGLLNSLGSQVAFRIDTLMVAGMIDIASGGIYAIVNVISDVITKPSKSIISIASPIISKSWKENDMAEIKMIYKKSSIILLIIGWYTFLGIWGSVDDLFNIMPKPEEIRPGKYVIFFLGLAKIIDLATSVNTDIINYSPKFRFNFYSLLILAFLNVILNLIFIPMYGLTGSAFATFCSITIFNLAKLIFIWYQFKMQPFSYATLKILTIAAISWGTIYLVQLDFQPIINILIRSILLTIIYGGMALFFNISPDVNGMVKTGLNKLKGFFLN